MGKKQNHIRAQIFMFDYFEWAFLIVEPKSQVGDPPPKVLIGWSLSQIRAV